MTSTSTHTSTLTGTPTVTRTNNPPLTATPTPTKTQSPVVMLKNLAVGKPASQSSTFSHPYSGANRAVDGVTDGQFFAGSTTHTNEDYRAWWQVDLGKVDNIQTIKVWNRTDCCWDRLRDFYVLVSDVPFISTSLNNTLLQPGASGYHISGEAGRPTEVAVNRTGRYVRVQLVGSNYLSLSEVEVWGGSSVPATVEPTKTPTVTTTEVITRTPTQTATITASPTPTKTVPPVGELKNLAVGMPASQSSNYSHPYSDAYRAVDGVTDGEFLAGSTTHTEFENQPWWQVDLGKVVGIQKIKIWNRTDCCSNRLQDFYILVSDVPFVSTSLNSTILQPGVSGYHISGEAGRPTKVAVNRTGRYVRVQLVGANYLSISELEVWGGSIVPPIPEITRTPTQVVLSPVGTGTFDDTNSHIAYSGYWMIKSESSAYQSSLHYSNTINETISLKFTGNQFGFIYNTDSLGGIVEIYVDDQLLASINQYSTGTVWQKIWDSPILTTGTHTLTMKHAQGGAAYLDALIVSQLESGTQYQVQLNNPVYIPNFAHPEMGNNWMGVAGQIFDQNENPVKNLVVLVDGTLNGVSFESLSLTGLASQFYGEGAYEIELSNAPINSTVSLSITLYDLSGQALSTPFYFETFADNLKNLILINFRQLILP
ncbi:MAG: discoidin domain-containing protein [Anaerolineaceae bacterium]|nr:discoidin domain-containing protein [Anaerolineaceae bacterium]